MILAVVVAAQMQTTPHVSKDKEGYRISESCSSTHGLARRMFVMFYRLLWVTLKVVVVGSVGQLHVTSTRMCGEPPPRVSYLYLVARFVLIIGARSATRIIQFSRAGDKSGLFMYWTDFTRETAHMSGTTHHVHLGKSNPQNKPITKLSIMPPQQQ